LLRAGREARPAAALKPLVALCRDLIASAAPVTTGGETKKHAGPQRKAMTRAFLHAVSLGVLLALIWLTLSGYLEPLLLTFGIISCVSVVLIAHRMNVIDHEGHPVHLGWRILAYWPWLIWEIVKSNIDVARRILDPSLPISPCMVRVKTTQGSDLAQVIYANSITLTPGTVSIVVEDDSILVHAVAKELADDLETGEMDRRVTAVETRPARPRKGA